AIVHRYRERSEVGGLIPDADTEDEASLGDEIQRDDVLRQMHRMMERQEDDGGADVQRARAGGHGRGHDERRRKETVLVLMVLTEEAGMEPARFCELGFGDDFVDAPVEVLPA